MNNHKIKVTQLISITCACLTQQTANANQHKESGYVKIGTQWLNTFSNARFHMCAQKYHFK